MIVFYDNVKKLVKQTTTHTLKSFIEEIGLDYEKYNGQRRYNNLPRGDDCVIIAQALNTTVEYLVTGIPPKNCTTETLTKVKAFLIQSAQNLQKSIDLLPPT